MQIFTSHIERGFSQDKNIDILFWDIDVIFYCYCYSQTFGQYVFHYSYI